MYASLGKTYGMKNVNLLTPRAILLSVAIIVGGLLLSGCEDDYIDIEDTYYQEGGPGTSSTEGALVFRVRVKGVFNDFDRAEF